LGIVAKFGGKLTKEEKDALIQSFPGQEGGDKGPRLNIARIYDQKYNNTLKEMYKQVDVENTMGADEPTDTMGFLGVADWYRKKKVSRPISEA